MLKESKANEEFEYQKLSPEEQKQRGILGRLVGVAADFIHPTRNGRKYSSKLWENVFNDPIMKEKIANHCCFGELGHPADRTETDMEKIAICLAEQPTKRSDGKLMAVFDILDTPNGRILKSLCDYGCNIGISSRGEGDLITDYEGNEAVDPDTYSCECWDAVLIPAVKEARMQYVSESLDKSRYNKTLREKLQESLDNANDADRKVMEETLNNLHINLTEEAVEEIEDDAELEMTEEVLSEDEKNSIKMAAMDVAGEENVDEELEEAMQFQQELIDNKTGDKILITGNNQAELIKNIKNFKRTHGGDSRYSDGATQRQNGNTITNREEAELEVNDDIKDESLDINNQEEALEESVAVENNEAIVEQLQELLKVNASLEQQVIELQEKLSVSYAKEAKIEEEAEKYKNTVKTLAESAREAKALQVKVSKLEQRIDESSEVEVNLKKQLTEANERINDSSQKAQALRENISNKSSEVSKLNESIATLKESLSAAQEDAKTSKDALAESQEQYKKALKVNKKLKEQFNLEKTSLNESIAQLQKDKNLQKTESAQKLEKAKKLVEKYKKATATAVDKYIELQAVRLGSSVNEVKNRLPESYSFEDIDKVCEDLQSYNLNMSRLPFNALAKKSINENVKIKGTSSKNESILPVSGFDDEIDEDLLYLAGRK